LGIAMPEALTAFSLFHADRAPNTQHHYLRNAVDTLTSVFGGPYRGAVDKTLTYLVQGHDGAAGKIELAHDQARARWSHPGDLRTYRGTDEVLRKLTQPLGGQYTRAPLWSEELGWRLITAHPLGGCPMGETAYEGVVDDSCRVFDGTTGNRTYKSLF